jgi:hypothetical protein
MAKDGVLPALVHLISLLDPREFDAPKRAVGVSLRLFEQLFSGHTPSQGSESVKGRLPRLSIEMNLVGEKWIPIGILQIRRFAQGIANIEVDGANFIGIPRQVGSGKLPILFFDLALQLRAKLDDLNLPMDSCPDSRRLSPAKEHSRDHPSSTGRVPNGRAKEDSWGFADTAIRIASIK